MRYTGRPLYFAAIETTFDTFWLPSYDILLVRAAARAVKIQLQKLKFQFGVPNETMIRRCRRRCRHHHHHRHHHH